MDEDLADADEVMIYEVMSDPGLRTIEKAQRSREGQYLRRMRRRTVQARLKAKSARER
jgi:hypothetical protein